MNEITQRDLHYLYWLLNVGGRWTERQWDRWDKRNTREKFKINTKFKFKSMKGRNNLGYLNLPEMIKIIWWTGHKV